MKSEDDISTDDENSPKYVISSSYDPVKREETDDEDMEEDTTLNEQHSPIKVKAEVKTEDESTDDEHSSEKKEPIRRRKSPRLLATAQPNASTQDNLRTKKKSRHCNKRKREAEESNGSIQKIAHRTCSVEGCTRKAAD